ncbi:MAG: hypothetical protein WC719_04215 [Patescibacteria group bacterium]|jgi:hypothetical protein
MQNQEEKNKLRKIIIYACGIAIILLTIALYYYVLYDGKRTMIIFGLLLITILCSGLMITFLDFNASLAIYQMIEIGPSPRKIRNNLTSKIIIGVALGFFILAALMAIFWL